VPLAPAVTVNQDESLEVVQLHARSEGVMTNDPVPPAAVTPALNGLVLNVQIPAL
jgi:hypothetical protein